MIRGSALALLASTALMPAAWAQALPTGGQVTAGQASITSAGTAMTITQGSGRAVINWQDFSVGEGHRVDIRQPDARSALLNRVKGSATSTIAGQVNANGQVYLVNPNGILITKSGSFNAAGFVASTLDLSDKAFMDGDIVVTGRGGSVRNEGAVSIVKGGYAALIGGKVENSGTIVAPLGKVALASGTQATLDLEGDGFLQVALPAADGGIAMSGRIVADGGAVLLTAGQARDAARGVVNLTGSIEAKGIERQGGTVILTGGDIQLAGAQIDVSGSQGGGTLARADTLSVDAASTIKADATTLGDGGSVVLWSDTRTDFAGTISARGAGGKGGDAEVSGKATLAYTGTTDLTGTRFGTLLLDPYNLTISNDASSSQANFTATGNDSIINSSTLLTALATANVTVATGSNGSQAGNIIVAAPLAWNSGGTLTLQAAGGVALNGAVSAAAGGLTVSAGSTATATADISVARFTLGSGAWIQNSATLPAFATADFRITGGTFVRAAGGAGTSASPWALTDIYGMQGMATLRLGNFILANDIDASRTATWNGGAGFSPIGENGNTFAGGLDGAGHVVSGLVINRGSQDYVGLIGILASSGSVRNIGLLGGSVSGSWEVGGLVGYNWGGAVSNAYATGAVSGTYQVGGLVGYNAGAVSNAYATGAVRGFGGVGGLVGYNAGAVSNAYATGAVSGSYSVGGLAGVGNGTVSGSYWDTQTTGRSTSAGGGTGLTTAQARSQAGYVNATDPTQSFDFSTVWYQAGDMRPILRSEATAAVNGVVAVSNLHQLQLMGANLSASYVLTADIDATATAGTDAAGIFGAGGFVPVGNHDSPFTGSLDGAGHVVSGLVINRPSQSEVGLIGWLETSGSVGDIGLLGGSVSGDSYVGGLVGYTLGTVSNAYATGTINGSSEVGGLVGLNDHGAVSNAYATGAVSGDSHIGGLVGFNSYGTVSNAYATGAVSGDSDVGGLVGSNYYGTVSNAYAAGAVSGTSDVGGLAGYNYNGPVSGSYWDTQTTGQSTSAGGGTGLTTAQARSQTGYINATDPTQSFDFSTVWYQAGDIRPILRSEAAAAVNGAIPVSNLHQLHLISANLSASYVLTRDIDASMTDSTAASSGIFGAGGFIPIGYGSAGFAGSLSGGGHLISGLTILTSSGAPTSAGLFNILTADGSISDLTLAGGSIWGPVNAGALVGSNAGSISNVHSSAAVSSSSSGGWVGGLAGQNSGTITDSSAAGAVSSGTSAGGLVGFDQGGTIVRSYAGGTVTGGTTAGGLVGQTNSSMIEDSYATGSVSGNLWSGGLVGYNTNTAILKSHATGAVVAAGTGTAGGLVAISDKDSRLEDTYASGAVTGGSQGRAGGLVGANDGLIVNSHASGAVSASLNAGGLVETNGATGKLIDSYATGDVNDGGGFRGGLVAYNQGEISRSTASGNVTGTSATAVGGFVGINTSSGTIVDVRATGDVSGGSNSIMGGLVGDNSGALSRVVSSGSVTGGMISGGLVGRNYGTISEAYAGGEVAGTPTNTSTGGLAGINGGTISDAAATGDVEGTRNVGGLVGENVGTIARAYANGDTSASNGGSFASYAVGGLVGRNGGSIVDVYATGSVTADTGNQVYIGGLVGLNSVATTPATITRSYATGKLTFAAGTSVQAGGLVGFSTGDVSASFWNIETTGMSMSAGTGATGLTNDAMRDASDAPGSFLSRASAAGWDFDAVWAPPVAASRASDGSAHNAELYGVSGVVRVSVPDASSTYGDALPAITPDYYGLGFFNTLTAEADISTDAGPTSDVGTYAVTTTGAAGSYVGGGESWFFTLDGTLTVDQRAVTVRADAQSRVYGEVNPTLTYTTTSLGAGAALSGTLDTSAVSTSDVREYAITRGTLTDAANPNYLITYEGANLTVTQRPITVVADAQSRIYGNANPQLTYSVGGDGLANGDALSGSLATGATLASDVGAYDITRGTLTDAANPNYLISYEPADLTVTPRPITIAADAQSRVYGDANPTLTYVVGGDGLVDGDVLPGALATSALERSDVGDYAITQGTLAAGGNYRITSFTGADLTVTQREISVVGATGLDKTYDGTASLAAGATGFTSSGVLAGDDVIVTAAGAVYDEANAGVRDVLVTGLALGGGQSGNYVLSDTSVTGSGTIARAPLTVTGSRAYDGTTLFGTGALAVAGGVNGETVTLTSGSGTTSANGAGTYADSPLDGLAIEVTGGNALASNYLLPPTATLTIQGGAKLALTALDRTKVYGETLSLGTTGFSVGGTLADGDSITGVTLTSGGVTASAGVASYVISISDAVGVGLENYAIDYVPGTLTVTPRTIIVSADALSRLYGDANPALTYRLGGQGLVNGDRVTGTLSTAATATSGVGAYAIGRGTLTAGANYSLQFNGAELSVTPRPITIVADAATRMYGDVAGMLAYAVGGNGLVNGDTLSGALATDTPVDGVGRYAIVQGTLGAGGNYSISFTGAELLVTPRPITVAADPLSRLYGDANPALTYTIGGAGLVNGDTLTGALATDATIASGIGAYAIGQGTLAASPNYRLSFTGAALSVTPRPITVTANALSRLYGDANPQLTYAIGGAGLVNGDTLSGALATEAGLASNVGTYAIGQGTLGASANYSVRFTSADLTVTPRPITITADSFSRLFGVPNPALTYTVGGQGLVNGDTLTGALDLAATRISMPGDYAIGQGSLMASANYAVTYIGGTLTVTRPQLTGGNGGSGTGMLGSSVVRDSFATETRPRADAARMTDVLPSTASAILASQTSTPMVCPRNIGCVQR